MPHSARTIPPPLPGRFYHDYVGKLLPFLDDEDYLFPKSRK